VEIPAGSDKGRLRRWTKVILIPTLLALLVGWLVSYAFPAKYTSQSLILVEGQKLPETIVQPVVSGDLTARIETLHQQVLSPSELRPVVERLQLSKTQQGVDEVIANIGANMTIEPVPDLTEIGTTVKEKQGSPVPGFYLKFTASNPREAQAICSELTSLMIRDNAKAMDETTKETADFLNRQVEEAKQNLDDLDRKVAAFRNQHAAASLVAEYDNARKVYQDLLAKQSQFTMTSQAEVMQLGERMFLLDPANLPEDADFPNRWLFAGGGLSAGLVFGIGLALWLRYRRDTVRIASIPSS
jgi:uncharacterized protein involved in exopolysaccharide biosynthesis